MFAEEESEFNYIENSEKGPAKWGEIHSEWGACSNGSMQSPIDMSSERVNIVSHLGRLKRSYKLSTATLKNRGHDMMVMKVSLSKFIVCRFIVCLCQKRKLSVTTQMVMVVTV